MGCSKDKTNSKNTSQVSDSLSIYLDNAHNFELPLKEREANNYKNQKLQPRGIKSTRYANICGEAGKGTHHQNIPMRELNNVQNTEVESESYGNNRVNNAQH